MSDQLWAPRVPECEAEWLSRPMSALATHISSVYHEPMRHELPILTRQTAELSARVSDGRVFHLHTLAALLRELRDEADSHTWTEDDLLFPVLAAHENPTILVMTLTPDRLLRLVAQLTEEHRQIRGVLARIGTHLTAVSELASTMPDWAELVRRVERVRSLKGEELDLEDRCLFPRARAIAAADSRLGLYR